MANQVVTVFGGSGFLGRYLIKRLADQGYTVRAAVRHVDHAIFLKPLGDVGQIVPMAVDINDPVLVAAAVDDADVVVNFVGILFERGRRTFQRLHVEGAETIAACSAKAGVKRLVHVSAIGADIDSSAKYARTKAAGETAVINAFPGASIVRPSVVFGPEDGFFNRFASLARFSPFLPVFGCPFPPKRQKGSLFNWDIYGNGGTKFQPVYVGDVAQAIVTIIKRSETSGEVYELGGPCVYSFKEIMELVLNQIHRRRLLLPLPFWLAKINAFFLEFLPTPLLTRDQVELLKSDNVVDENAKQLKDLGISPTVAEAIIPRYLPRYRPHNRRDLRTA